MTLYDELPNSIKYDGKVYQLDLSFTSVLAAFDALEDESISPEIQTETALDILVKSPHRAEGKLLVSIARMLSPEKSSSQEPVLDYKQDWPYIYAGFLQAYGVDLYKERGLHWFLFSALLRSLPDNTRLMEIIGIRMRPIPPADKYNAQERAQLIRLKAEYALKSQKSSFKNSLRGLAESLIAQAKER